jgi:hypothetical protein
MGFLKSEMKAKKSNEIISPKKSYKISVDIALFLAAFLYTYVRRYFSGTNRK